MSTKHTPGPWHVDEDDRPGMSWNRHIYSSATDHAVCFMAHSGGVDAERDKATAHLIAAAPELLDALRAYVREHQNLLEGHSTTPTLMADAEAAIQKATAGENE
jgi:hypothetical protein